MAQAARRLPENAPGEFYVDETCIDCGACRWIAPASFDLAGERSFVKTQPRDEAKARRAEMALIACPTASIGTAGKHDLAAARAAYPARMYGEVFHCGWHAEASFGAAAWLVRRPHGNILVDSPRFAGRLVRALEDMGGVRWMFLSHRDDVADHARFAAHFGATRILHADDVSHATRGVEWQVEGDAPVALTPGATMLPVPGHTRGSMALLVDETLLFTGDHLAWSPEEDRLVAWRDVCWYDWRAQTRSMARLAAQRFEWVLSGHGTPGHRPAAEMACGMEGLVRRMRAEGG
ncbi:MAG: MBL fold metallo-hydrolase [Alphaproteobacteria bacterium]|nr:MBL fold metallo-hydrolase [Alphaproteobacteria bacterium]